jgi:DNA (cytosine-5)-methyltransferase 1
MFAGMGALTLGVEKAGFTSACAMEMRKAQCATFALNRPSVPVLMGDVTSFDPEAVVKAVGGNIGACVGGVPCEGFSTLRRGTATNDPRRELIHYAMKMVAAAQPEAFIFENVAPAVKSPQWQLAVERISKAGYGVAPLILRASDVGGATIRRRAFLIGLKGRKAIDEGLVHKSDPTSPADVFKGLGEPGGGDPLHQLGPALTEKVQAMVRLTTPGQWLTQPDGRKSLAYAMLAADKPAPTITALGKVVHFNKQRWLTVREMARIQGIPDDYKFADTSFTVGKFMLGDCVPVPLGFAVGTAVKAALGRQEKSGEAPTEDLGEACVDVAKCLDPFLTLNEFQRVKIVAKSMDDLGMCPVCKESPVAEEIGWIEELVSYPVCKGCADSFDPALKDDDLFTAIRKGLDGNWSATVEIIKADAEKKVMTGVVLEPDEVDAQGDTITAEVIERAAFNFLANFGKTNGTRLGLMHKQFGDVGLELVQSWVTEKNERINGKAVKKGTWLMSVRAVNDALWKKVKAGLFTGFSIGGVAAVKE